MINATLEARLGSKRFPNKILKKIGKKSFLEFQIDRIKKSKYLQKIIVATTLKKEDTKIVELSKKKKVSIYRGSSENVLKRLVNAHKINKTKIVVRLCGDNPFQDPDMIDDAIKEFLKKKCDLVVYGGGKNIRKIPYGFDVEVLSYDLLKKVYSKAKKKIHLEHPIKYVYDELKNVKIVYMKPKNKKFHFPKFSFGLDYPDQQVFLQKVHKKLNNNYVSYKTLIKTVKNNPKLLNMAKILSEKYILNRKY